MKKLWLPSRREEERILLLVSQQLVLWRMIVVHVDWIRAATFQGWNLMEKEVKGYWL
jgi:hypothetical protein